MTGKLIPFRRVEGTVEELSDTALLSAVAEGDRAALGALYDRFHRDVFRFTVSLLRDDGPHVDDLVQNTFLEAFRSARRFRKKSQVKTWLFGIAANLVRQHRRSESRRDAAMSRLATVPTRGPDGPAAEAERSELLHRVGDAIDQLPPSLREAYVMCVVEEVPGKAAAAALGIRAASLWRRLHDARKAIRRHIEDPGGQGG